MQVLSNILRDTVAAMLSLSASTVHQAAQASRPLGKRAASGRRRKTRMVHPRNAGASAGAAFLGERSLHPGHSSSLRKLQRAFRIAGRSFTPEGASKGRGR